MIKEYLSNKLATSDLVLAEVEDFDQQKGKARLIEVYRTKYLFADKFVALKHMEFSFVGGSGAWGETPNYPGELGFLFLSHLNGRIYQNNWHGHIPVQRHDGELWCVLYFVKLWETEELPDLIQGSWKPGTSRLDAEGKPFDSWVKFGALQRYLQELIGELDGSPCQPIKLADASAWLDRL